MKNELAVSINRLTKTFDGKEVIRNCSMSVGKGTIYGFIGENGAGKTTVFKILLGLLKPSMGEATVLGMDCVEQNIDILKKTGSLIETPIFYEHLSATQNLEIHLDYIGMDYSNIKETLELVGLCQTGSQAVSTFSLGMRQRLGIARALVHKPELLILDEPINGLDPVAIKEMRDLFLNIVRQKQVTILLSSHILSETEMIADKIGIIKDGTVIQEILADEIKEKYPMGLEDLFLKIANGGKNND